MRSGTAGTRTVAAWAIYDLANSAFTTLVVTFIYSAYFSRAFASDPGRGTALWSYGIAISALLIAVLSPVLGAIADRGGRRRRYLMITTYICILFTIALTFIGPSAPHAVLKALAIFVAANVAFEVAMVFYNAFLPSITTPDQVGRVSGIGWSVGYVGGMTCMLIALLVFMSDPPGLGLSTADGFNFRATNLLVAGWYLLFSIPMFLWVKDDVVSSGPVSIGVALEDLRQTFHSLRRYRDVSRFLIARLVYNDGLVTVIAFGSIFAMGTFGMTLREVTFFGMALNISAGLGALVFGFVDDRIGGRNTVLLSLAALSVAVAIAVLAPTKLWLWVAGILIGLFLGPNQAASRSLMARFTPLQHQSEFFGFFAFSGKVTSFMGPLLLGQLALHFGQRAGIASVLVFFLFGGVLLLTVDERAGAAAAQDSDG